MYVKENSAQKAAVWCKIGTSRNFPCMFSWMDLLHVVVINKNQKLKKRNLKLSVQVMLHEMHPQRAKTHSWHKLDKAAKLERKNINNSILVSFDSSSKCGKIH